MANGDSLNIVLVHGFPGFPQLGELDYFKGVKDHLNSKFSSRNIKISIPALGAVAEVEKRAGALRDDIEEKFNGEKVHIIAHSGGGLDARWLVSPHPDCLKSADLVSSITTISAPHHGALAADLFADHVPEVTDGVFQRLVENLQATARALSFLAPLLSRVGGIAELLAERSGLNLVDPRDKLPAEFRRTVPDAVRLVKELADLSPRAARAFSSEEMEKFNERVTNADDVTYTSYAGVTGVGEGDLPAPIFYPSHLLLLLDGKRNDGWVTVESAMWGEYKGEIPADHADQIGHDLSPSGVLRPSFDHLTFYEKIVRELADA